MTGSPHAVALLAPMPSELRPVVRMLDLRRRDTHGITTHDGHLEGVPIVATRIGIGRRRAGDAAEALLDAFEVRHVVIVGVAGGVRTGLAVGDLVVPVEVVDDAGGAIFRAHGLGDLELRGRLLTTDGPGSDESAPARAAAAGFDAVDMETAAVAAVCERHDVSWTAVRALSDHADEDLVDRSVFELARPDGTPNPGAVARYVLTAPWRIRRLARLGRDLRGASEAAARAAVGACREQVWTGP